jgi:adenylyl-sulfate kinase
MMKKAKVLWFTGLSGSGKTTISVLLREKLISLGLKVFIIDGDVIRDEIHTNLGFSREDIRTNNKLIAESVKSISHKYDIILVPIISPFIKDRNMAREIIGNDIFHELFINTPINECQKRDPKGLYKRALNGEIRDFIGISDSNPYEPPKSPDLIIDTLADSKKDSVEKILNYLLDNITVGDSI